MPLDLDCLASNLDALLDSDDSKDPPSVAAEEADGTCSTVQRLTMKAHQGCVVWLDLAGPLWRIYPLASVSRISLSILSTCLPPRDGSGSKKIGLLPQMLSDSQPEKGKSDDSGPHQGESSG